METFDTNLMLFFAFSLTFAIEIARFWALYALKLNLVWTGGWRYAYYLQYVALCAGLGSGVATFVFWGIHRAWLFLKPNVYTGGFFLVLLSFLIFALLSSALTKGWPKKKARTWAAILTLIDLVFFVWKGTRFFFGGTLLLLFTSAIGQIISFTSWNDLVRWVNRVAPTAGEGVSANGVRVQFFIEVDGALVRTAKGVEIRGEIVDGTPGAQEKTWAQKLLERIRIATLVESSDQLRNPPPVVVPQSRADPAAAFAGGPAQTGRATAPAASSAAARGSSYPMSPEQVAGAVEAVNSLQQRLEFEDELAALIAANIGTLNARRESIDQSKEPTAKKEELLRKEVQRLLEQRFGKRLRSLLYWHYDMPKEGVRLSVTRAPKVTIKPMLSLSEYMGIFVSLLGYGK